MILVSPAQPEEGENPIKAEMSNVLCLRGEFPMDSFPSALGHVGNKDFQELWDQSIIMIGKGL